MPTPDVWTFTQLSGKKTQLKLGGWSAPFGRPRKGAIVNAGLNVRETRTDYPGTNLTPTIHAFGTMNKPFELHGRWMDQTIPEYGGAQDLVRTWKDFVSAQAVVRASWGQILSYQIFIHDVDLEFESAAEVAWAMKAHALVDEQAPVYAAPVALPTPIDVATMMQSELEDATPFDPDSDSYGPVLGMMPGVVVSLALALQTFGPPFASLTATCAAQTDFETTQSSDLGAMLANLETAQSGLLLYRGTTDFMVAQAADLNTVPENAMPELEGGLLTGDVVTQITTDKAASDAAIANLLSLIASMRRAMLLVTRGQAKAAYIGLDGDTWESVGLRYFGAADAGRSVRAMNGIRNGIQPQAGRKYTLPKSA